MIPDERLTKLLEERQFWTMGRQLVGRYVHLTPRMDTPAGRRWLADVVQNALPDLVAEIRDLRAQLDAATAPAVPAPKAGKK